MPLASTVKTIIAIEYAVQAAAGKINPDEEVGISELEKFHVKNTDGGAHPKWLDFVKNKINDDKITVREIAKGMIRFSSNANTEWLCQSDNLQCWLAPINRGPQTACEGVQFHILCT